MKESAPFIPLNFQRQGEASLQQSAQAFFQLMSQRRTVREFSEQPIPQDVLEYAIRTAGTASTVSVWLSG